MAFKLEMLAVIICKMPSNGMLFNLTNFKYPTVCTVRDCVLFEV